MDSTYVKDFGVTSTSTSTTSIDNNRRIFNFGERVAELAPQESPFYVYLNKVSRKPTDDPVFKFLEQRHQWQRRYAIVADAKWDSNTLSVWVAAPYDIYGREICGKADAVTTSNIDKAPTFFLPGQLVTLRATDGTMCHFKVATVVTTEAVPTVSGNVFSAATGHVSMTLTAVGATANIYTDKTFTVPTSTIPTQKTYIQIVGSAFGEATGAPDGWYDKLYDREGYTQIFKTAIELMSGTAMATRLRGRPDEWARQWGEKLREHKIDIEEAMLFGKGYNDASNNKRYTWGILPYTEAYGKTYSFNYATTNFDSFLDAMEDYFAPESGNNGKKLLLTSRKVINWLNRLGKGSFTANTAGTSSYNFDIQQIQGKFGHKVQSISTIFGDLMCVEEPLLRNGWEDYAISVDMKNVAVRPLVGNGQNRDTWIETNIQTPGTDGRKDLITTETGLEISLPETHALLKFN
jgi:hypothetical protein